MNPFQRAVRTYLPKICAETRCSLEDLPETMDYRNEWWERESGKSALAAWHGDDDPINPTSPLGQDMTQGQFFKRSLAGLNSEFSFY